MKKYLPWLLVLVFFFVGFYFFKKGNISPSDGTKTKETALEYKTDFYEITAIYPAEPLDKNGAMKQFVTQLVEQRKEEWKIGGQTYNEEKNIEKQFPDRPKMVYSIDISYKKFQSEKKGTTSYLFEISQFTGGANMDKKVQAFTFNKNGQINIDSILNISEKNSINLSNMIFQKTKSDKNTFPDSSMVKDGLKLSYLKSDGATIDLKKCQCNGWSFTSNLKNFVLTDEGITFYFNRAEITIGAAGSVGVDLSWDSLTPYINNSIEIKEPSREAYEGCKWEKVNSKNLTLWGENCDFGDKKIKTVANEKLPGVSIETTMGNKAAEIDNVIQIFSLKNQKIEDSLVFLQKNKNWKNSDGCTFTKDTNNSTSEVTRYILKPTGDTLIKLENDCKNEPVLNSCAGYGMACSGIRYFEIHSSNPSKALFMEIGQEAPLFDEKTIVVK